MRLIAAAASVAMLAGCVTTWTKPGATEAEFARDKYECERDVRQSNFQGGQHHAGQSAGEQLGAGMQDFAAGLERINFFQECLAARGYQKASP